MAHNSRYWITHPAGKPAARETRRRRLLGFNMTADHLPPQPPLPSRPAASSLPSRAGSSLPTVRLLIAAARVAASCTVLPVRSSGAWRPACVGSV